ncbi:RDD family protein [Pseudonocardia xinjiangensis]|uniref:RDD family protein n=1 Tax=Pseudonocardia xinjiangensis TaxID=75289 RepID=A0ABX1RK86_9PSEU|nr:RDD family protein [Pseudonocardia xinjiangensis]NMH80778.1 RDD family protein [Pseudonocardia xinjiangensis]
MARWIESWMPGSSTGPPGRGADGHPGQRFGLPAEGVSSVAGFGRRLGALLVDWLLGYLIALLVLGSDEIGGPNLSWAVLGIWFLLTAVPVAVFGASAGMTLLGIRVASIDSAPVIGIPRALLRTALIALVLPAVARDGDGRGWHDRAARTIVVRTRA